MLKRCHQRHVVGFKHVETRGEDIGQLTLVDEHGRLTFAHSQFRTILDLVAFAFKTGDHGITRVVDPVDDVDEFTGQKIKNTHLVGLLM